MAAAANGRRLGPRALRTRKRLLDATAELLRQRGLRGASVVEIARRAGTSPASFYQYFSGVEAATLELAGEAAQELPEILALLEPSLRGAAGLADARALVGRFLDLWDTHHAVLRVRNHAAEEGSRALPQEVARGAAAAPRRAGGSGSAPEAASPPPTGFHPYAAAAALATVLESAGAYHRELEYFGVDREALIETSARILVDTVEASRRR